jgi:hypothetical protein
MRDYVFYEQRVTAVHDWISCLLEPAAFNQNPDILFLIIVQSPISDLV